HCLTHRRFRTRDSVALDERSNYALRFGNPGRVLHFEQCCECEDHCEPPIHRTISVTNASTSRNPTVSTAVSPNRTGTETCRTSSNGPCRFFTLFKPAVSA